MHQQRPPPLPSAALSVAAPNPALDAATAIASIKGWTDLTDWAALCSLSAAAARG